MTFSVPYNMPSPPPGPGKLTTPITQKYVDFDVAPGGDGSFGNPWNDMPGLSIGDARVSIGMRITCRGTLKSSGAFPGTNFGQFLKGGTAKDPVVYVGNDPGWGQATIDGSVQLTPTACANQAEAKGNVNWASMRKATIGAALGGASVDDWPHCLYGGADREMRYFAGYPQLANDNAFRNDMFFPPTSILDIWWYPGINPAAPNFVPGSSRPRLSIASMDTWLVANNPGYTTGDLAAALDTTAKPILQMVIMPQLWFWARIGRCDADGTLNTAGAYVTPIDGSTLTGVMGGYSDPAGYLCRIINLPKAIDRGGTYAMDPVAGWLVEWPVVPGENIYRAQGKSGFEFARNYIWLHGFKICGMSSSLTVPVTTGATGGNSLTLAPSGVDSTTLRVQRNYFPGSGSCGYAARQAYYINIGHAQIYHNTLKRTSIGSAIGFGDGSGCRCKFNSIDQVHGSNIRCIGSNMKDVVIGGNKITNCNDIHGNGITLYICKYGVIVEYNYIENVGRPTTSEIDSAYNSAVWGTPSTIFRHNTMMASFNTVAAIRQQSSLEEGWTIDDNNLWGGTDGLPGISLYASMDPAKNNPFNRNDMIGAALYAPASTLATAGVGNTTTAYPSGPASTKIAAWQAAGLDPTYVPQGVGWTAGGWDGNS